MELFRYRLKSVSSMESIYQLFGACIMLLSSTTFLFIMTCPSIVQFSRDFSITAAVSGFLIGALLAHGIQKTTFRFLELLGMNFYIIGWAFILNGLLISNTYFELYLNGALGVYIVFLGVMFYFIHKENPTELAIENHILVGAFLVFLGILTIFHSYYKFEVTLFYLIRIRSFPPFWIDRGIVSILVGVGILLISLFMYFLHPSMKNRNGNKKSPVQWRLTVNRRNYE